MAKRFHLSMASQVFPFLRESVQSATSHLQEVSYAYSESIVHSVVHRVGWW